VISLPSSQAIQSTPAYWSPTHLLRRAQSGLLGEKAKLLRLRGFDDIRRWLAGNFTDDAEWREMPDSIEVARGVIVPIQRSVG